MAVMVTVLHPFSTGEAGVVYDVDSSTSLSPRRLVQKRKVPTGKSVMVENGLTLTWATTDADTLPINEKVAIYVTVRYPKTGQMADVDAALAVMRDIVSSDEFTDVVSTSRPLV